MSNLLPCEWKLSTLESNAKLITDGAHASPPSRLDGKPIATVQNMLSRSIDVSSCRLISRDDFDSLVRGNCAPEVGDVLFSKDGTVGKTFVYRQPDQVVLLSSIAIIRLYRDRLDPEFCAQFLLSPLFYHKLENTKSGSAIRRIVLNDLKKIELPKPPLPEQQKIATILSSVDDVIEKTRAQIDKLKDLKTGMMQELLTKGIGHTHYKPVPKWSTGKIPEIERIPVSWELVNLTSVARLESGHTPSRENATYWGGSIPWLSLHDTKNLTNPVLEKTVYSVTQEGIDNSSARLLPEGTVAFSRTASVGNCVILGKEMATSQDFANYICSDLLNNRYLLQLFRWMQHVWAYLAEGSTHKTIYMPVFKKLQILLPPLKEQVAIADAAESTDKAIKSAEVKLQAFIRIKKALMQDLLTGKVRVDVEQPEPEIA